MDPIEPNAPGVNQIRKFSDAPPQTDVYEAWHSTDTIARTVLATGKSLSPLRLEGYDGWILGMSVTGDGRLLISADTWGGTVYVFDAETGGVEGVLWPSTPVFGLACVDRR